METLRNPNVNFPLISGLTAVIVTGMLLVFIAGLTSIEKPSNHNYHPQPVFITHTKPPELIEPAEEEEIAPKPMDTTRRDNRPDRMPRPETAFNGITEGIRTPGDIVIPTIQKDTPLPIRPDIEIFDPFS